MNNLIFFRNSVLSVCKNSSHVSPKLQFFSQKDVYGHLSVIRSRFNYTEIVGEVPEHIRTGPNLQERVYEKPVDWLPFRWDRLPRFNPIEQSGDTITKNECDLTLPRPDFELSDELKSANAVVKRYFSLENGFVREINEVCRRQILKRIQRHPNDFDSLEVRIALMTIRVRALFEHNRLFRKKERFISRVCFPIIIQKRNKLLKELRKIDEDRFNWILKELHLYYIVPYTFYDEVRYTKKWDLRKLTKEYCEKMVADKKAAYHAELKKQQEEFLEEKKQILEWIEEEEKALQAMKI